MVPRWKIYERGDREDENGRMCLSWGEKSLLLLLRLSRFSCVRLCASPRTAAHQAPPSLGFSRQEYWSGLPFPSPMHESEKWKWSLSVVYVATPWTAAYQVPPSMGFARQEYWSGLKHAIVTFLSVLGKKQKETMSIINISSLSCTIPNSPTVRRI